MQKLDMEAVAKRTKCCGKKIKISQSAGLLYETFKTLDDKNPTIIEVKQKIDTCLYEELVATIITFYSLNLLARTHTSKELETILKECEINEEESEA